MIPMRITRFPMRITPIPMRITLIPTRIALIPTRITRFRRIHPSVNFIRLSEQLQDHALRVNGKVANHGEVTAKYTLHSRGTTVAEAQPENFRGRAAQYSQLCEVFVFGCDDEVVCSSVKPDLGICGTREPQKACLCTAGIDIRQTRNELVGKVMVE